MDILSVEKITTVSDKIVTDAEDIIKHNHVRYNACKESIVKNKWFYLSLLVCFVLFKKYGASDTSYGTMIFSFLFILIMGYLVHRIGHNVCYKEIYNKHKKNAVNYYVDYIITTICEFVDFHTVIHHDTSINKKPINICYEFIHNVMLQGGLLVIGVWCYNRFIDNRIILLWALSYATIHNINYLFIKPSVHRDHHIDDQTNYAFDIADIIFDTKYDITDIESHNHMSINFLIITGLIIYITS